MLSSVRSVLGFCAVAILSGGAIYADTIEFNTTHPGGTVSFSTAAFGTASINNAVIDQVKNQTNSISFAVSGACGTFGCLNLTTGALISNTLNGAGTIRSIVYSGTGSSLTISGTAGGGSSPLLTTKFDGNVTLSFHTSGTEAGTLSGLLGYGALDPTLAAALGVPFGNGTVGDSDTENLLTVVLSGSSGTGDVTNSTVDVDTVPDSGMALIFLSGALFGIEALRRRLHA